jgi:prepilin-type N-terminal cleavage/methylation domain-containing protein
MARPGFTIIELMVTITVIALLLGVTTIYLENGQVAARDTQRLSDLSLIGKMVDTSATALRGTYPSYDASTYTVCADELWVSAANPNQIDYSIFPGTKANPIPLDPKPATPRTAGAHCANTGNGYIYQTKAPASSPATAANALGRAYVLEVALEKPISSDQSQFATDGSLPVPAGRYVYILAGPVAP